MNHHNKFIWLILIAAVLGVVIYVVWRNIPTRYMQAQGGKVRFYQDSMHPWVKANQPGKCTICAMDLTPIYEGENGFGVGDNLVILSSNSITVLNVQTEEVKRRPLNRTLRVAGTLEANETRKTIVSAPSPGRIDTLDVAYAGVEVKEGQPLITLFSPELVQKRGYFLTDMSSRLNSTNVLFQISPNDPLSGILFTPLSGTVIERPVFIGQYVTEGEKLLTIADASVLWFRFDVYERQLSWVTTGQSIEVTVQAVPGRKFPAVISFIEPMLDDVTRAVKVRADVNNPVVSANGDAQRLLKFGMYAEGRVRTEIPDALAVPRTAILFPGGSAYAYVDKGNGAYERRRVTLGRQGDELWEVLRGLEEGDRVVTAGNVLIDAQAQFNQGNNSDVVITDETTSEVLAPAGRPPAAQKQVPTPMAVDSAKNIPETAGTQISHKKILSHVEMDKARMALRDKMWIKRNATIAGTREEQSAGTPPAAANRRPTDKVMVAEAGGATNNSVPNEKQTPAITVLPAATPGREINVTLTDPPSQVPETVVAQISGNAVQDYRNSDKARMAISAEMRKTRNAAAAGIHGKNTVDLTPLTASQRQALQSLVTEADGIGRALAADDVGQFNERFTRLSAVLPPLQKELAGPHRWEGLIQRLIASSQVQPAKDLTEARKQFLPFSAAMVDLAGRLRKEDPSFAELKIYHCPMAPPPGVWIQIHGPLRNPFYGSKMLKCGEEVKP